MRSILAEVGAELIYPFLPVQQSLEGGLDPDVVGFVRYPSQEAFEAMWNSDAYQAVAHLREEAITKAILTRCVIDPADAPSVASLPSGVAVLNALWFNEGGAAGYDRYLEAARPLVQARGGTFLTPRFQPEQALGEDFVPDLIFLGWYPSLETVFEMVGSTEYAAPGAIRSAAVHHSATTVLHIAG